MVHKYVLNHLFEMKLKYIILSLIAVFFLSTSVIYSQCNLLPNALPGMALVHQNTNCFNNSGVAFNPNLNLYYGVRAGNSSFPLETWTSTGVPLYDTLCGFDWRGMWWNPTTNQLEGNGFNTFGMWKADLNASGYALSTGINLFTGMNQPDAQSVGDLDWQAYEVLYYFNDYIYRYSRATNTFLGSYQITGTPVATSNLNSTTLMYTGCPGKEIALLDYVNLRVYVYDKATGAYAGMSQLPPTAVTTTSFRTSWTNCAVWLFDLGTLTWFSYKIFDDCAVCNPVTVIQNPIICYGDSVFVGGNWQTGAGAFFDTLVAASGCDSIIASVLNILPSASSSQNFSICSGDSIFLSGSWHLNSGTFYDTLSAANGCDSIVTNTLGILPSFSSTQNFSICFGDSVFLGSAWRNSTGFYYDSLTSVNGCDSIIESNLNVFVAVTSAQNFSICNGDSIFLGSIWQNNSGTYYDTLIASGGCDSVVISTLNIISTSTSTQFFSICNGDSIFIAGSWRNSIGTYYDTLSSTNGCDSIVANTLNISPFVTSSGNASICSGGAIFLGGAWQSSAGIYHDTLAATTGCDSVITTTLLVTPAQLISKPLSICQGGSAFLEGKWQTQPGIYRDTLTALSGCDSILATYLSVDQPPVVDLGNDTILCTGSSLLLNTATTNAQYLWQDNSMTTTFLVIQEGIYWLRATNNCGSNTDSIFVEEKNCECSFYIPNSFTPNDDNMNDEFMPAFDCPFIEYQFMIFNCWGEKIFETEKSADSWDGNYKGKLSQMGVYVYSVTYKFDNKDSNTKFGKVTLIR